ncbi:MAG: 50S ribosomal protein L15 [Patescibacteria group bacterium]
MQLHEIKPSIKRKNKKRVGRGGKRGTYSGKGLKGQKSRAGAGIKPGFRGGDTPLWKKFHKSRGATKKLEIKKLGFQLRNPKPAIVNLKDLNKRFADGEVVSPKTLFEKKLVKSTRRGVKILGKGELRKKLVFKNVLMSQSAKERLKNDR